MPAWSSKGKEPEDSDDDSNPTGESISEDDDPVLDDALEVLAALSGKLPALCANIPVLTEKLDSILQKLSQLIAITSTASQPTQQ